MPYSTYKAKFPKKQQHLVSKDAHKPGEHALLKCWGCLSFVVLSGCLEPRTLALVLTFKYLMLKQICSVHTPKVMWHSHHLMPPGYFHPTGNSFSPRLFSMASRYCSHRRLITPADSACKEGNLWIIGRSKTWTMQDVCWGEYTVPGRLGACFTFTALSRSDFQPRMSLLRKHLELRLTTLFPFGVAFWRKSLKPSQWAG